MKTIIYFILITNLLFAHDALLTEKEIAFEKESSSLMWSKINLNKAEKKWLLEKHKVRILFENRAPYMYEKDDKIKGIAIDYIKQISKKNNFQIEFIKNKYTYAQAIKSIKKQKEIDLILVMTNTKERSKNMLFSNNYILDRWVIITKTNEVYIGEISDLYGKVIATTRGHLYNNILKQQFPHIKIKSYNTNEEAILAVSTGQANAYIGIISNSTYIMQKYNITNLKVAAPAGLSPDIKAMAVRKDWSELVSIINKSLEAMPAEMHNLIRHNSLSIHYTFGISKGKLFKWGLLTLAIITIIILILQNNNRKLKLLINSAIEAIVISKEGKIIDANNTFIKMYGESSLKKIKGKEILDFVGKEQHDLLRKNLNLSNTTYELNIIDKYGKSYPCLIKGTNISKGKRISTIVDLSELKKAQNKLKLLNKNLEKEVSKQVEENRIKNEMLFHQARLASMGEMINNIAHQWRQPLSNINSIVIVVDNILRKENVKNTIVENSLCDIESQTKYMSDTIENFRNFFLPNKQKKDFTLSQAVSNTLKIIDPDFKRNQININLEIKKNKEIQGYRGELIQVLITILNNSKDALLNSKIKNKKILITIDDNITIEDNAGGIKEDTLEKIFEPYFTTKHPNKGTGIGLYMAKMIIEDSMNGIINVENRENGARFTIEV